MTLQRYRNNVTGMPRNSLFVIVVGHEAVLLNNF